jgi:hypothetical protein
MQPISQVRAVMNESPDPCSAGLCDVMRDIVQHDFAIENCRELMREWSRLHAAALTVLVRYHEWSGDGSMCFVQAITHGKDHGTLRG